MDIKNRIKKLGGYFKEMQVTTVDGEQVIYVIVDFPRGWLIDEKIEEKFPVTVNEGTKVGEFYFCADIDTGEDAIFDAIDYNIDKMKDAIERARLLSEKTKELKDIFENEAVSLEELRELTFTYGKPVSAPLITSPSSKRGRKSDEAVVAANNETVSVEKTEEE